VEGVLPFIRKVIKQTVVIIVPFIRKVIKQTVVIIEAYHFCQVLT